jgi:cysteine desulfuration protein SufE
MVSRLPEKLREFLDTLRTVTDRSDRIELLIGIADRFQEVPAEIASRPFPRERQIPHCESEAYVWPMDRPDGTLKLYFAVENPQGISARAMAVILDESLSGAPLEEVVHVADDLPFEIFGRELSMGKSMGLNGMVAMVSAAARERLAERRSAS